MTGGKPQIMDLDAAVSELENSLPACMAPLSAGSRELLGAAALWLARTGVASGLSQYRDPAAALLKGMAPAAAYFSLSEAPVAGRLADLGAGNGAIGATIAILAPDLQIDLADRAQRAYTACELLGARLGLRNLRAVRIDARTADPHMYDAIVFRALARGPEAISLAARLVRPGGFIGAYHRSGDRLFTCPGAEVDVLGTVETLTQGLSLTGYRS